MTADQEKLMRRFAWLCAELAAGNQFSREQLMVWYNAAMVEVAANQPEIIEAAV